MRNLSPSEMRLFTQDKVFGAFRLCAACPPYWSVLMVDNDLKEDVSLGNAQASVKRMQIVARRWALIEG